MTPAGFASSLGNGAATLAVSLAFHRRHLLPNQYTVVFFYRTQEAASGSWENKHNGKRFTFQDAIPPTRVSPHSSGDAWSPEMLLVRFQPNLCAFWT